MGHIRFLLIAAVFASQRATAALSSATVLGRGLPFAACMAASVVSPRATGSGRPEPGGGGSSSSRRGPGPGDCVWGDPLGQPPRGPARRGLPELGTFRGPLSEARRALAARGLPRAAGIGTQRRQGGGGEICLHVSAGYKCAWGRKMTDCWGGGRGGVTGSHWAKCPGKLNGNVKKTNMPILVRDQFDCGSVCKVVPGIHRGLKALSCMP